ncbi:MAG: glutaredoxin domain-containing protein [Actinomycetes bacterium]|jgi:mycoredoxin
MTSSITMFGAMWCGDCRRSKRFLDDNHVSYEYIDTETELQAAATILEISGRQNIPLIIFPDGTHLTEPSDKDLKEKLESLAIL